MKKIVLGAAVLMLLAGTALGVQFKVTSGGSSSAAVTGGGTLDITISLDPQGKSLVSWQAVLSAPAGFKIAASPGTGAYNVGTAGGWDAANGLTVSGTYPKEVNGFGPIGTIALDPNVGNMGASAVYLFTVTAPADVTGLQGVITLSSGRFGDTDFNEGPADSIVGLAVTPEPVSMLLLLAGIPMLRRRR